MTDPGVGMPSIEPYMWAFQEWAKHEPNRCRIDPDGPAVYTTKLGPSWQDITYHGPLWFALLDALEECGRDWSVTGSACGYAAWVSHGRNLTDGRAIDDHSPAKALLLAYARAIRETE